MPAAIQLFIRAFPRRDWIVGQGIRFQSLPQDAVGAAAEMNGVFFTVVPPSGPPRLVSGASLGSDPLGPYLDVVVDLAGTWVVRVECTGPLAAAAEIKVLVSGSDARRPADPGGVFVTRDLWALLTQQGLPLTGVRIPALPRRAVMDGTELLPVVGSDDVTYGATLGSIAQIAALAAAAAPLQIGPTPFAALLGLPIADFSDPRNSSLLTYL